MKYSILHYNVDPKFKFIDARHTRRTHTCTNIYIFIYISIYIYELFCNSVFANFVLQFIYQLYFVRVSVLHLDLNRKYLIFV